MSDLAIVLARLGGRRGLVDGAAPPLLFAATEVGAGALGHDHRALPAAVTVSVASAVALGVLRRVQGATLAGVLRGLLGLAAAAGVALWTGRARDFFLPGMYVDGAYAAALGLSALVGRPLVAYAYAALFRTAREWRHDRALRRVLSAATLGWAATYAVRVIVQVVLYRLDEPELLAVAKLVLGWPLTAVAVVLTLRATRRARVAGTRQRADSARQAGHDTVVEQTEPVGLIAPNGAAPWTSTC